MAVIAERLRERHPERGKQRDIRVFETYITYSVYGRRYCRPRRGSAHPKIVYESLNAAQRRADEVLDAGHMRWEYQHFDHWHLTSLAPLLVRAIPPAIRIKDGPGSKKSQLRHLIPYRPKSKFRGGAWGNHFQRITMAT